MQDVNPLEKMSSENGMPAIFVVGKCPGCKSESFKPTGPEAPEVLVSLNQRSFLQPAYFIRECAECGLLYRSVTLSEEALSDYYRNTNFRKWITPGYYPTELAALSLLRKLPKGAKILDFGCSSGRLLTGLVGDYVCHGYEINAEAAAQAAGNGLTMVSAADLESGSVARFDAVVLIDVFEHLTAPTDLLTKLARLLTPEGIMLIVTGNGDSHICRKDPGQFWYFRNVEHVCMLTRRYTDFLASSIGKRVASWETVSHYDVSIRERIRQHVQDFAYWEFQSKSLLSKIGLRFLPVIGRARQWREAPAFNVTRDHVLTVLSAVEKQA